MTLGSAEKSGARRAALHGFRVRQLGLRWPTERLGVTQPGARSKIFRRAAGLTLIELLVALTIMAFSLTALYRATGGQAQAVQRLAAEQQALLLAESLLAARGAVPPEGWAEDGAWGKHQWQIRSAPRTDAPTANAPRLHHVRLVVQYQHDGRTYTRQFDTLLPEREEGRRAP